MKVERSTVFRWLRRIALVLAAIFVLLQLIPVERENPPVLAQVAAPPEVLAVLRRSCFDCHSHESRWPWYSYVNPVAWWVADHVREARDELNFSVWPTDDPESLEHAFEEIREVIDEGEMPLQSYLLIHRSARLSEADRKLLIAWASGAQ